MDNLILTKPVPEYDINLGKPANKRWQEIIDNHADEAVELLENALEPVHSYLGGMAGIVKKSLALGYSLSGGHFEEDIQAWAEVLGLSESDIVAGNTSYELAQAAGYVSETLLGRLFGGILGCTAVAMNLPGKGMIHLRNLDWDLDGMGESTIVVNLKKGRRKIVAVTNPGLVGVLSGMVPGKFSITLNWAPPSGPPRFNFGPIFLIRWVLENARDFEEAVEYLSGTPLSSPCFFMVTGPKEGEACVIERTFNEVAHRWYDDEPLVVANHYLTEEFEHLNEEELLESSEPRYDAAMNKAKRFRGKTLKSAMRILGQEPVFNEQTCQRMGFGVG